MTAGELRTRGVRCDTCGAAPGLPCRTKKGRIPKVYAHAARWWAGLDTGPITPGRP